MAKLTKKEIIRELHIRSGLSQRLLGTLIDHLLEEIKKELDLGREVKISGFGTFGVKKTRVRPGRNPKTGEVVMISPFRKVYFHLSPSIRKELHNEKGK